jgi:hypothetical protein
MPEYRAYIISVDERIQSRIELICDHEADAMAQAKQLVDGYDVELWQGARKVARFSRKE